MRKLLVALLVALTGCSMSADSKLAEQAVVQFHEMLDAEQFDAIYEQSSDELKKSATKEKLVALLQGIHKKLGATRASDLQGWKVNYQTSGSFVTLTYSTFYVEDKAQEQFVYRLLGEKALLVSYHIESDVLITK